MFVLYVFFLYAGRQLYVIFDWNRAISVDYCTIFAKILISVAMVTKMIIIKNKNSFSCSYIITYLWYQNQPNWLTIMWSRLHDFYLNRHLTAGSNISITFTVCEKNAELWWCSSILQEHYPGPQIRVGNGKLFFLFLNQNICYGYSKEPSHWDGSFEHPKHMFKLMDKKIIAI